MDDIYTKIYKDFKAQFPYWVCFLAGVFYGLITRILRDDPWWVGVVWFVIALSIAMVLLGIWFVATKPDNRLNTASRAAFVAWSLVIGQTGTSLLVTFLSSDLPPRYRLFIQFCCIGGLGLFLLGFVIYIVVKYTRQQNHK